MLRWLQNGWANTSSRHESRFRVRIVLAIFDGAVILLTCLASLRGQNSDWLTVAAGAAPLLVWQALENGYFRRRFQPEAATHYPDGLLWPNLALAVVLAICLIEREFAGSRIGDPARWIGVLLCAVGVVMRLWAFHAIGSEFLKVAGSTRSLLHQGPYSILRHPASLGFFAIGMGVTLAWGSVWGSVAAIALLLPSLIYVVVLEQKANRQAELLTAGLNLSQRLMAHPLNVRCYEGLVHPLFLMGFTRSFRFTSIYRQLRQLAGPHRAQPTVVLDLACGTAWFARRILQEHRDQPIQVVGVDLSDQMLEQAARLAAAQGSAGKLRLARANLHHLDAFADASVDEAWLCGALHQIPDPAQTLKEAARVLSPAACCFARLLAKVRTA
jgi:protein-S-isoprenylcysteine O-methyltransferase Ste14